MTELLAAAIEAHGGMREWSRYRRLSAELSIGGEIWRQKRQTGLIDQVTSVLETREESVLMSRCAHPQHRITFSSSRVTFEEADSDVVESCYNPRSAFSNQSPDSAWNEFHVAYFSSSAIWTSLVSPFLFTYPGFLTEELEPWIVDGAVWRRLKVTFPDHVATHTRELVAYFGPDGLLRRSENVIEVLGARTVNRASGYKDFQGIRVPTVHQIFYDDGKGSADPSDLLVVIEIGEVMFS